ncbi:MinD/ParA family protein [Lachnospiraceae bacterium ZAX-1]
MTDQAEQLRNIIKQKNQSPVPTARVFTITSGKGGVGKSNIAVNLAVQLRKLGKRVIIFDADFGLANIEVMFGTIPKYNLSDLIYRGKNIQDIITTGPLDIGFVSGGSGIAGVNNLARDQITYLIRNLKDLDALADVIIVDTGAGISDSVLEFVMTCPEVLLITTSEPSSLTDAYSLLKALHRNPNYRREGSSIKVIANKVTSAEDGLAVYDKLNAVVSQFLKGKLNYLGMIPQDDAIEKAIRMQEPVTLAYPDAKSSQAFEILADNLMYNHRNQPEVKLGITQLFLNFFYKKN